MRGVDQQGDVFVAQEVRQPISAAETADAGLDRLRPRVGGTTGKRDCGVVAGVFGQPARQFARLGGAAQYQNARFFHG
ncbi:hypothetical protein D9M70_561450 [compost metagenome]